MSFQVVNTVNIESGRVYFYKNGVHFNAAVKVSFDSKPQTFFINADKIFVCESEADMKTKKQALSSFQPKRQDEIVQNLSSWEIECSYGFFKDQVTISALHLAPKLNGVI